MFTISWTELAYGKDFLPCDLYESLTMHERYDDETLLEELKATLDALAPNVEAAFRTAGLEWDDDRITVHDDMTLTVCGVITNRIMSAYDSNDPAAADVWPEFGLGGDDDVDYNGSYPITILDILDHLVSPMMRADGHAIADSTYHYTPEL